MSLLSSFDIGATGLTAQAMRLNVISSNIANVERSRAQMVVHIGQDRWSSLQYQRLTKQVQVLL